MAACTQAASRYAATSAALLPHSVKQGMASCARLVAQLAEAGVGYLLHHNPLRPDVHARAVHHLLRPPQRNTHLSTTDSGTIAAVNALTVSPRPTNMPPRTALYIALLLL